MKEEPIRIYDKYDQEIQPIKSSTASQAESTEIQFDFSKELTFIQCIAVMLTNSDQVKLAATDITLQRILQDDAFYKMFPTTTLNTGITWNMSESINLQMSAEELARLGKKRNPIFRLNFSMIGRDPISNYFKAESLEIAITAAKIAHHKIVAESIYNLAQIFMKLEHLQGLIQLAKEAEQLAYQATAYAATLSDGGYAATIETMISKQREESARARRMELEANVDLLVEACKGIIGLPSEQNLKLDVDGSRELAASYDPKDFTLDNLLNFNFNYQLLEKKVQAGDYQIFAAVSQYYPRPYWTLRTPDPYNNNNSSNDSYYFTLGFTMNVVDWGAAWRSVEREHLMQRKAKIQISQLRKQIGYDRRKLVEDLNQTRAQLNIAKTSLELKKMELKRIQILYNSGTSAFPQFLTAKSGVLQAEMELSNQRHSYENKLLSMRNDTGALSDAFIYRSFNDEN
jgi:outer membrane protein TolC